MIKKTTLCIFFAFLLTGCKENKIIKSSKNGYSIEYSINENGLKDGEYKELYPNGNTKELTIFDNGKKKDSSIYFLDDKSIEKIIYYSKKDTNYVKQYNQFGINAEGQELYDMKIGKWKYYNSKLKLDKIMEYINVCDKQYLNQSWYYDNKGNIIKNQGNWLDIRISKKRRVNDTIRIDFLYHPLLTEKPTLLICNSMDLDINFCNERKVKLDTLISVSKSNYKKFIFTRKGKYNIRGFIEEHNNLDVNSSTKYKIRHLYFNIPINIE